jgi:hypothetical protein
MTSSSKFFQNTGIKSNNTAGVVKNNVGQIIFFKRLVGSNNISISETSDKITITLPDTITGNINVDGEFKINEVVLNTSHFVLNFSKLVTSNYDANVGEFVLIDLVSASQNPITIGLPSNTPNQNDRFGIKIATIAAGNYVAIDAGASGSTIDGSGSINITSSYESAIFQYFDSGAWYRVE